MIKIILSGDVGWEITVDDIREQLDKASGADLDVHLASPGGSVFDGIQIFNLFRDYKRDFPAAQLMLTIKGEALSMAAYIAVNPAWDLIAAEDNAVMMIHNAWGGVVGDYREVAKMAEILDGLTGIYAQVFAPRMKISIKAIRSLMDDESWYFGAEMLEAGFVDEIIKTDFKKNKAQAVAETKLKFLALSEKLGAMTKTDVSQIAAMIKPEPTEPEPKTGITPAQIAGNNTKEVNAMTLTELLAQNPTAQIEYNAAFKKHGEEKFDAGVVSVQERIAGVLPYIKPDSVYPAAIKELAVDVIEGKYEVSSIRAAVATYDAMKEKSASEAAALESKEKETATGEQTAVLSEDGEIHNEIDFAAVVKQSKIAKGMEVN